MEALNMSLDDSILEEIKRLSITLTNHTEADRADFSKITEEMKTTQEKFVELMVEIKVIKGLLGWVRSISGIIGGVIIIDVVGRMIK